MDKNDITKDSFKRILSTKGTNKARRFLRRNLSVDQEATWGECMAAIKDNQKSRPRPPRKARKPRTSKKSGEFKKGKKQS